MADASIDPSPDAADPVPRVGAWGHLRRMIEAFWRENRWFPVLVPAALVLSFGLALTSFSVGIDEELHLVLDFRLGWASQGRFTITLLKLLFGEVVPLPFFNLFLSIVFLALAAMLFLSLFNEAAKGALRSSPALLLAGIFFATLPIHAYYLTFNTYNFAVSAGLVFSALAVILSWHWVRQGGGALGFGYALIFAILSAGTYQSLIPVSLTGLVGAFAIANLAVPAGSRAPAFVPEAAKLVLAALPILAGAVLTAGVSRLFFPDQGYTDGFVGWGKNEPAAVLGNVLGDAGRLLSGGVFPGSWVLIPATLAAAVVLVAATIRAARTAAWLPPILVLGLFVLPFALSLALGTTLPLRAQQSLPLAFAIFWLLLALVLPRRAALGTSFLALAMLVAVWNGGSNTRLFLSRDLTFQYDRALADHIAIRLAEAGWDGAAIPLVVVGKPRQQAGRFLIRSETFGASTFAWGEDRWLAFMYILGHQFAIGTEAQFARGYEIARTLPIWPLPGSAVIRDGIAVVNLGEAPKPPPEEIQPPD